MSGNIAVIDIGSNSVRLMVFDDTQTPPLPLINEKQYCALGAELTTTGLLCEAGRKKALETLAGFKAILDKQSISKVYTIGTEALRAAGNAAVFIEDVKALTGFTIEVISGEEEGRLASEGVLSLNPHASGIVADFGGGSLELARIGNNIINTPISLKLGALRLKNKGVKAAAIIDETLSALPQGEYKADTLIVVGGSWRALMDTHRKLHNSALPLQGYRLQAAPWLEYLQSLKTQSIETLCAQYGLETPRAGLVAVSALMLEKLLHYTGAAHIEVSTAGVRDGVIARHMRQKP
jgi:exopolyphosphatase/guanosine-5'-triphosphate,3'-diphosphate pyrophosphatase